jgi:hypothetical protein
MTLEDLLRQERNYPFFVEAFKVFCLQNIDRKLIDYIKFTYVIFLDFYLCCVSVSISFGFGSADPGGQ